VNLDTPTKTYVLLSLYHVSCEAQASCEEKAPQKSPEQGFLSNCGRPKGPTGAYEDIIREIHKLGGKQELRK